MSKISLQPQIYETEPENWRQFLAENEGFLYSSSLWATVFEEEGVGKPVYIKISNSQGKMLAACLAIDALAAYPFWYFTPRSVRKLFFHFTSLRSLTAIMQPVFLQGLSEKDKQKILKRLIREILTLTQKRRIGIAPFVLLGLKDPPKVSKRTRFMGGVEIAATTRVSISEEPSQEWLMNLNHKLRNTIRSCEKKKIAYLQVTSTEYYHELKKSWGKKGLLVNPKDYYGKLQQHLPNNIKYWLAKSGDKTLAGTGLALFEQTGIEFSMFSTEEAYTLKIPGGDGLKWHLLQRCQEQGIQQYDLCMIDYNEQDEKTRNINFYKLKWGGAIVYGYRVTQQSSLFRIAATVKNALLGK